MATIFRIGLYETLPVLRPTVIGPGTSTFQIAPAGNSILASLWVKSIDVGATVSGVWYDYAVGVTPDPAAKYVLGLHPSTTTAPYIDRRVIPKIHNQVFGDIIVSGGSAEVSLLVSVVSDFPFDVTDGIELGAGEPKTLQDAGGVVTTPGVQQELLSFAVPAGKAWRLRSAQVNTRAYGAFEVTLDGARIGAGISSPAQSNPRHQWAPYTVAAAGQTVKILYTEISSGPAVDIAAFLQVSESSV